MTKEERKQARRMLALHCDLKRREELVTKWGEAELPYIFLKAALDALDERDLLIRRLLDAGASMYGAARANGHDVDDWDSAEADAERMLGGAQSESM